MEVSIIIPVYNAEQYLEQCIQSLVLLSSKKIEFIFVNDGSTDRSKQIIEQYQNEDKRIIIVNQSNQGVSVARNKGLEVATGKWVSFVDSDDWIDDEVYEEAISELTEEISMMVLGFGEVVEDEIKYSNIEENKQFYTLHCDEIDNIRIGVIDDDNDAFKKYKRAGINCSAPWAKFYRLSIIRENKVTFPNGIHIGEDKIFNYRYMRCINSITIFNACGYFYRITIASTMQKYKADRSKDFLETVKYFEQEIQGMNQVVYQFGIRQYLYALKLDICNTDNKKSYKQRKREAKELREQEAIARCFERGNIYKLRLAAIPMAFLAKKSWFGVSDFLLRLKQYLNIRV